ncbi:MAG: glycosyltransferase family 2 protein [Thermodesulfovibrionales bacterium]
MKPELKAVNTAPVRNPGNNYPLSIAIISFNEEKDIKKTLESIRDIASEIIVVDSHSTDRTREIAQDFGAVVFEEDWKGYVGQKNSALQKCTQEWILSLDCDEIVTPELKSSIMDAISNPIADGYLINRKTVYLGRPLNYAWQPDLKLRLVRKSAMPRWRGYDIHESLEIDGKIKKIQGDLLHYSYKDLHDHLTKLVRYAMLSAQSYQKIGRRFSFLKLILHPIGAFLKQFIIKRAFLDGFRGLIVAFSSFCYVFFKYLFLWEMERDVKRSGFPRNQ